MRTSFLAFSTLLALSCPCLAGFGDQLKSYGFGTSDILRDPERNRVYCTVPSRNSLVVIDSETLEMLASVFTGSNPAAMSIAPDGKHLYVANSGSSIQGVAEVELEGLTVSRYIATQNPPSDVAAGSGLLYTLDGSAIRAYSIESGLVQTGSLSTYSGGVSVYSGMLELSGDSKTLYYYQFGLSPTSWYMINVSNWPGTATKSGSFGSNGQDFALSPDGKWITFASGAPYYVTKASATDPTQTAGQMNTGAYPRAVTYSADGNKLFAVHTTGHIDVWNANTFVQLPQITSPGEPRDLECDRTGNILFAGSGSDLHAYLVKDESGSEDVNVEINRAVEIRWNSISGRLYQVEWSAFPGPHGNWHELGGTILGNGLTMSIYDTTRNQRSRFYRVTLIPQ